MIKYSKIVAKMLGILIFFIVFLSVLFYYKLPPFTLFFEKLILAFFCSVIVWFWAIVAFDFLFKGILEDIDDYGAEGLLEGGIFQRFQMLRRQFMPGGEYMPFVSIKIGTEKNKENVQSRDSKKSKS